MADATVPATRRPRKSTSGSSPRKSAEKENATIDVGTTMAAARKKSRSKSMGPGALDALKSGSGNRRASLAAPPRPPPRSILKPTIPILPEIPPHKPKQAGSNSLSRRSPSRGGDQGEKVALRTEDEQQAAAREREEKERAALEKEINDRREARRKSLANRRVSFAAEATLHTFHEIEYVQDSTTSTDSTRRASSLAASTPQQHRADASDPPSTPPEQVEDVVPESPADQRDLHQRKRRRSSGISALGFNNPDDHTIGSTVYDSDSDAGDAVEEDHVVDGSDSDADSDSDDGDGTLVTIDAVEMTSASITGAQSVASPEDSSNLDDVLRLASQRASDQSHETRQAQALDADEELIPSFGWGQKAKNASSLSTQPPPQAMASRDIMSTAADEDDGTEMDMDMTQAQGGIIHPIQSSPEPHHGDDDMSMDVTQAFGGILSQPKPQETRAEYEDPSQDDTTMDLTLPMGKIHQAKSRGDDDQSDSEANEDMSMELTTVLGGVLGQNNSKNSSRPNRRRTIKDRDLDGEEMTMDMTVGVGKILSSSKPAAQESAEDTMNMDMDMEMTMAMGGILKPASPTETRSAARKAMEEEVNCPEPASTTASIEIKSPARRRQSATKAGDAESPGLSVFHGKGLHRTPQAKASAKETKLQKVTPSKPTPVVAAKPNTPVKSSPVRSSGRRSSSPRRPVSPPKAKSPTPRSSSKTPVAPPPTKVFERNAATGATTPLVVLTPQKRRLSGVGADRTGLGSPKVAQIFERRDSIGNMASDFIPGAALEGRKVAFEDPRNMEREIDREHQDEEDKEDRRKILEREADGLHDDRDITLNLKEMIQSLSPKKNPMKGRKSLHVGSAKGVLGKRPAELDNEEEEEEIEDRGGVKRLKGLQASPVKKIRLQQPPSKEETTGRVTRARKALDDTMSDTITPTTTSPGKPAATVATPKGQGRFKDVASDNLSGPVNFAESPALDESALQQEDAEDRIHLQDFLNMTSIRFMELTTTKRRHTVAPGDSRDTMSEAGKDDDVSLEKCVVTGACTVPMLELYQHSCRELKKYISEGRSIVHEMETETFEENPPLFREYMSASPEFKTLMDNQFKNVKTHARLLSKAMWYEWRTKLQEGMREGLLRTREGMAVDEKRLQKQQQLVNSVLPEMVKRNELLERQHEDLEIAARELADCDPADLQAARADLLSVDKLIDEKKRKIAELRAQLEERETAISALSESKQHCLQEIEASVKIREECRGWSSEEVASLKAKVDSLEKKHGWAITGVQGTTVSMTYLREIELVLDAAAFRPGQHQNSPIDLWYIAGGRDAAAADDAQPCPPEREFFLQCIRDYLRGLSQPNIKLSRMLAAVRAAWDKARWVANQARILNLTFPTSVAKTSDSSIAIRSSMLLVPLQTKVDIVINLHGRAGADGVEISVAPQAGVVYGEQFNAAKMTEFLVTRVGNAIQVDPNEKPKESWGSLLEELKTRLLARGRK